MGRLIDAYDLKYQMFGEGNQTEWTNEEIADAIDNQPTAYDVDKVVEQLVKRFDFCQEMAEKNDKAKLEKMAFSWRQVANGVMDAIYIVKGAVKDD